MRFKHIIIVILLAVALSVIFILNLTSKSYDSDCMFQKFPTFFSSKKHIDLHNLINKESGTNLEKVFPYQKYLASDNWKTVSSIRNDLSILDSITNDPYGNMNLMSIALTNKMQVWETGNLDSLNLLLNWGERFHTKSVFSDKYDIFYESVYGYWMSFISLKLDSINQADYSIKYNCKFNYLRMRCRERKFGGGDRDDNTTKAVRHIIEKDWFYLFNRFWIGTSILFKTICFLLLLITLYGYVCIIQKHLKKNKV